MKKFVGLVPNEPGIRDDPGLDRWITHLPDPEQKARAEKRRNQEVVAPPATTPIVVPTTAPTLPTEFLNSQQHLTTPKLAFATRMWAVLLTHPHAVSQADLVKALKMLDLPP